MYDVKAYRVPNGIILSGLIISFLSRFFSQGGYGLILWLNGIAVPFLALILLYLIGALGAGDIKLFMMAGGFIGAPQILQVIFVALIIGAAMSVFQLFRYRNFRCRIHYLIHYIHTIFLEKRIQPYYNPQKKNPKEVIPFSVAVCFSIFILILIYQGKLPHF